MAGAGQVCAMVMLSSKPCFNFVAFQGQPGSLAYPSGPAPPPGPGAPAPDDCKLDAVLAVFILRT